MCIVPIVTVTIQGERLRANLLERYYGRSRKDSRKDSKPTFKVTVPQTVPTHGPGSQMLRRAAMTLADVQVTHPPSLYYVSVVLLFLRVNHISFCFQSWAESEKDYG